MTSPAPDPGLDERAAALRGELAQALCDSGDLVTPAWRDAFERVPRHVFVPAYYDNSGRRVSGDDPDTREEWLAGVYADRTLITQRTDGAPTSSSTVPSLMAEMLEALDITDDGTTVLEIGTGTGYNAALLAHRLGERHVTTVDLADELTEPARERLTKAGYRPRVITGDGAHGYAAAAPYGRVLATCGIESVPPAWLDQLADGGLILAPLGLGLARIHRTGPRTAEGRFIGTAAFMPLRHSEETGPPKGDLAQLSDAPGRPSTLPTAMLFDNAFRFLVGVVEPGLVWQYDLDDGRSPNGARVWSSDGSIAGLDAEGTVTEAGPRRLWTRLEAAYAVFRGNDEPAPDRYGISISGTAQRVWLDTPDGPSWPLSA
ncbi:methyltransferase domain-containing protein [Streptomyces sp. NPDC057654]|uniref:methyltransferase domain-containing protein n=1 Tax=Streptomyces sp. NPDC057654 TaxID=3346196 RepID=UPI00367747A7